MLTWHASDVWGMCRLSPLGPCLSLGCFCGLDRGGLNVDSGQRWRAGLRKVGQRPRNTAGCPVRGKGGGGGGLAWLDKAAHVRARGSGGGAAMPAKHDTRERSGVAGGGSRGSITKYLEW